MLSAPCDQRPRLDVDSLRDRRAVVVHGLSCSIELLGNLGAGQTSRQKGADFPLTVSEDQDRIGDSAHQTDQTDLSDSAAAKCCAPASDWWQVRIEYLGLAGLDATQNSGLADRRIGWAELIPGGQAHHSLYRKRWVGVGQIEDQAARIVENLNWAMHDASGFHHGSAS